ncbi:MAG: M1 family metallopeptidase [Candidatus Pacebacteria bacterium]|nr:M1 family metallopeptidase [Candidatus Paceibacterota bacterium]
MDKNKSERLPKHIFPVHYEITLEPDLEAHTFKGEETITIKLEKNVKEITMHSNDLDITSANLLCGKEKIKAQKILYDKELETATFVFSKQIKKGETRLHLQFSGILANNMRGFYKSKYAVGGKNRFMAATQFEATDARRCIPCFDEPAQKAVFAVHLIIPKNKTAVSNTLPVATNKHRAGFEIVSFAPTPKMSTYLLAFLVGDFEWLEQKTSSGVLVRVIAVPGKKEQGKFALDVAVRTLEFYEKYFDIPYPLNTLDLIAVPDFAAGAMENWGAITFREELLLVDKEHSSTSARESVANVIVHEITHQWFGNLVTMEWWADLWLNEGFASYMPYIVIDTLFPEWKIWEKFVTDDLARSLKLDALKNTHPVVEVQIHNPDEICEMFDAISYSKGATVIGMLASYLGEKDFRDGLRFYLKEHSYKNTRTIHLWDAFEKISKKPVKKMMEIWTEKSGYPLVSVSINQKSKKLDISQKRYFSSRVSARESGQKTLWPIPLSFISSNGVESLGLMDKKSISIPAPLSFIKLNPFEGSMYRTQYDGNLLAKLKVALSEEKLTPQDRLGIIRDLFALAEAEQSDVVYLLEMLLAYRNEKEYIVWVEIISGLASLHNLLFGSKSYELFKVYAQNILSKIISYVGWEPRKGEPHNDALLRILVLSAGASFENIEVVEEAKNRFKNRKIKPIGADFRSLIYASIVRNGGQKEFDEVRALCEKENMPEEKDRLFFALTASRDRKILKQALAFIMTDHIRLQDKVYGFAYVLINPYGRILGWKFIKKNWKKITKEYGKRNHMLSTIVSVLNRNTLKSMHDDIKTFFKENPLPSADRTILQALEKINSNILWLKKDEKKIYKWLAKQSLFDGCNQ